ncbi:MAG TPA: fused MFS/spermidine synthase [Microbacteriaceae bacterium]|nr:fused MFS/spermidine synthase [Microbacteriaceae bacterium]HQX35541.1 fused MFS/spermidine synthase [Microbacteriaceae bacterium]HQZ47199.1 fused MFS/spermidine synthase [Microbacteriaceae bacterium]HRA08248.1 fused MFS/spermidine synthase [Microbacteriaceae bacterium]
MSRQRRDSADAPTTRLSDGTYAQIVESTFTTGYELIVDGTPQSHVDLDDPTHLHFEYVARMGAVIDQLRMPGQPLTAIHLGAGAMTVPRYIEATRPGSRQQVVELESALVDLVRGALPLPKGASIRVRHGDARAVLQAMPAGLKGTADLLVSDVFAGAQTPAHVTSVEFYREVSTMLAPEGVLLVNLADGPGLAYARRQVATVRAVLPHVAVLAEAQVLKGRRFGNLVLVASAQPLPLEWLPRLMAAGPHPAKVATGREIDEMAQGALVVMDVAAVASPKPDAGIFGR